MGTRRPTQQHPYSLVMSEDYITDVLGRISSTPHSQIVTLSYMSSDTSGWPGS